MCFWLDPTGLFLCSYETSQNLWVLEKEECVPNQSISHQEIGGSRAGTDGNSHSHHQWSNVRDGNWFPLWGSWPAETCSYFKQHSFGASLCRSFALEIIKSWCYSPHLFNFSSPILLWKNMHSLPGIGGSFWPVDYWVLSEDLGYSRIFSQYVCYSKYGCFLLLVYSDFIYI